MELPIISRGRGRASVVRPHSRNRQWVSGEGAQQHQRSRSSTPGTRPPPHHHHNHPGTGTDGERWERGGRGRGSRGSSRGVRKFPNASLRAPTTSTPEHSSLDYDIAGVDSDVAESFGGHGGFNESESLDDGGEEDVMAEDVELGAEVDGFPEPDEPVLETPEEREKFYQSLVKARELERKAAIAAGKMDDPSIPKRLEDAISIVGTCQDMCPRFERYRRERENNLFEWETIPGTKRVDHKRAVKMYERAAGDKTLPSDLRPPHVLKKTLDYLFHDLLPRGGFSATFNFIRDRSRAVRNDFTMQHSYGPEAIECHDRCARFHILALHFERERTGFSIALEEQQLMNTLQSLKEFYEDQRGRYESPTELEMWVYHRLIHIRDQKERHESIPEQLTSHPVFKLTTDFRLHVQRKSAPISKTSSLVVDAEGMQIFASLANMLREQGNIVMIYLVACILERHFGKEAIDDIEAIRGGLGIPDIIDGVSSFPQHDYDHELEHEDEMQEEEGLALTGDESRGDTIEPASPRSLNPTLTTETSFTSSSFPGSSAATSTTADSQIPPAKPALSAFASLSTTPNVFGTPSPFGTSVFPSSSAPKSVFGAPASTQSIAAPSASVFGSATNGLNKPSASPESHSSASSTGRSESLINSASIFPPNTEAIQQQPPSNSATDATHINGSAMPALNPTAPAFVPRNSGHPPPSLTPLGSTPSVQPFQRSSNPSPSPLPLESKVPGPSTPAPPPASSTSAVSQPSSAGLPPSQRRHSTTPPVLPKINTDTSLNSPQAQQPHTPTVPPPLPKHQPISLPLTPSMGVPPMNPLLNFRKASLGVMTPVANISQEILSPLLISSPTTSEHGLFQGPSPFSKNPSKNSVDQQAQQSASPASLLFTNGIGASISKGKARSFPRVPSPSPLSTSLSASVDEEELDRLSTDFERKSQLVRSCFSRWRRRMEDLAAWLEACQQSEAYKLKLKRQRQRQEKLQSPTSASRSEKRRRVSSRLNGAELVTASPFEDGYDSPMKKRARRRISSDFRRPLSDEDLARRFKENHKEHERRWAQGSFLETIRRHVRPRLHTAPNTSTSNTARGRSWRVWLSTNPYNDATAIWLERKFDVPASGDWVTETAFSIPLTPPGDSSVPDSPGLIVFERTSQEGVEDVLERKYRILDDCARLRDIVNALPPDRHFIPSLLLVSWAEGNDDQTASDFADMVKNLVEDRVIYGYHILSVTSKINDLDGKLGNALNALVLDVEGILVKSLNLRGVFKLFEPEFKLFVSEWIENCTIHGQFEWQIFGQLVQVAIALINTTTRSVLELISEEPNDVFPTFDGSQLIDNNSTYTHVIDWLSSIGGSAESLAINLQTHRSIGRDFPALELFDQLRHFSQQRIEQQLGHDSKKTFYVPTANITAAQEKQQAAYATHKTQLGKVLNMSVRRSPKRRSTSVDTDLTSSHQKRRRFSSPVESRLGEEEPTPLSSPYLNGRLTPSPTSTSISLAPSEGPPVVTVAMLRALTRDIRRKYASSS